MKCPLLPSGVPTRPSSSSHSGLCFTQSSFSGSRAPSGLHLSCLPRLKVRVLLALSISLPLAPSFAVSLRLYLFLSLACLLSLTQRSEIIRDLWFSAALPQPSSSRPHCSGIPSSHCSCPLASSVSCIPPSSWLTTSFFPSSPAPSTRWI